MNFADNGRHLADQDYNICIKQGDSKYNTLKIESVAITFKYFILDMCSVMYEPCDQNSFKIGPRITPLNNGQGGGFGPGGGFGQNGFGPGGANAGGFGPGGFGPGGGGFPGSLGGLGSPGGLGGFPAQGGFPGGAQAVEGKL